MLMLLPDAVQALTGLNPAAWVNRIEPLAAAPGADWQAPGRCAGALERGGR
ncbi:MAG: hypothetical protein M3Y32_11315 [Pseudomonadota bacterium]|nr:hypothetical protein [Pseudomonadota bacterium]